MTAETHGPHGDVHEVGLQDGCGACTYAALYPFGELDDDMLASLLRRVTADEPSRSDNEGIAAGYVRDALNRVGRLSKLAPETVALWIGRWGVTYKVAAVFPDPAPAAPEDAGESLG